MSSTKDTNYESHVGEKGQAYIGLGWAPPINPLSYDDIKKFSQCEDCSLNGFHIPGGREDCVDAVRGKNFTISDCVLEPQGKRAVTLKGSLDGWTIRKTTVRPGKEGDIEVGQFDNYWTPGRKPTRNGYLYAVGSGSERPVRVVLWDADKPRVEESNVKITKVPWVIWFPYFLGRYLYVRAKGIPTK